MNKNSAPPEIEEFLQSGVSIPPQPKILTDLEHLISRPNVNMGAIADLVGRDAAITAAVFKIINSPVYGLRKPLDSLEQAISVIGLSQIVNIVKSAALRKALGGNAPFYEWFWERSSDIAQLCSIIAWKQRAVCNIFSDQAYLIGLFHDCGVPILMQRFPDYCKSFRLAKDGRWPDLAEEDRQFSTNHCVAGYLVARHWHLPDFICQAVRLHHEILSTEHKATTTVAILQLAMHIHNVYTHKSDAEWETVRERVLDEIGLGADGLKEFEEEVYDCFKQP